MTRPSLVPPPWLRAAAALRIDRVVRRIRAGSPLVVMYHGISAVSPYPGKFTSPAVFRQHLDGIERLYTVVSLADVAEWIAGRVELPDHALAITFDDAYANLLDEAIPELARRGYAATIFASSLGFGNGSGIYWFDELDVRLASRPDPSAPARMGDRDLDPAEIRRHLKSLPKEERDAEMVHLRERHPVPDAAFDPYRVMCAADLRRVAAMGFDVGGHTASHVILGREDEASQREEVISNHAAIGDATGHPPALFAYPNGRRGDIGAATRRIVREAGYRLAVTTEEGFVGRDTDPFLVPRISAGFFGHYGMGRHLEGLPLRVEIAARRSE